MRLLFCCAFLIICLGFLRADDTNESNPIVSSDATVDAPPVESSSATESLPPEEGGDDRETHIFSDSVELGIETRSAVYRGNVRLMDPRLYLTCEQLMAVVPEAGQRVEQIIAETNVVVVVVDDRGQTNRAYADRAVYTYEVTEAGTNEVVELTGASQPRVEREEGTLYGDVIIWDRTRNRIRATNQRMVYRAEAPSPTEALSAASETNAPVTPDSGKPAGSDTPDRESSPNE
jgi:lipopolysaccharide export system protein LptA